MLAKLERLPIETADEVLEALRAGQFHALVGLRESVWLEAKRMPYVFDTQKQKLELAKDVSAMANASGGIIVVGFKTERRADVAGEYISEIIPFPASLVDSDRYMKLLEQLVYPFPHGVDVLTFESPVEPGKAVAAVLVNSAAANDRPYLVGSMVDEQEQSIGAYFGFFERRQDVIPTLRIAQIQQQLSVGLSLDGTSLWYRDSHCLSEGTIPARGKGWNHGRGEYQKTRRSSGGTRQRS